MENKTSSSSQERHERLIADEMRRFDDINSSRPDGLPFEYFRQKQRIKSALKVLIPAFVVGLPFIVSNLPERCFKPIETYLNSTTTSYKPEKPAKDEPVELSDEGDSEDKVIKSLEEVGDIRE